MTQTVFVTTSAITNTNTPKTKSARYRIRKSAPKVEIASPNKAENFIKHQPNTAYGETCANTENKT